MGRRSHSDSNTRNASRPYESGRQSPEHTGSKEESSLNMLAQLAREKRQETDNASHPGQPRSNLEIFADIVENPEAYRRDFTSSPQPITDFSQNMSHERKRKTSPVDPSDFTRPLEKQQRISPEKPSTMDVLRNMHHEQTNPSGASFSQKTDTHPTSANLEESRDAPRAVTEHLNAPRWQEVRDRYTVVKHPSDPNKNYFFSETWTRTPETPKLLMAADVKAMMRERTETHLLERADNALREASAMHPDDTDLQEAVTSLDTFKDKREAAAEPLAIRLHFTQLKRKSITIVKFADGKLHERIRMGDVIVTNNTGKFWKDTSFRADAIDTATKNANKKSKQYGSGNDIVAEWHNGVLENGSVVDSNTIHFYGYTGTNSNNLFIYLKKQGDGKNTMYITDSEQSLARTNKLQQTFFSAHKKDLNKQMEVNEPAQDAQPTSTWRLLAEGVQSSIIAELI